MDLNYREDAYALIASSRLDEFRDKYFDKIFSRDPYILRLRGYYFWYIHNASSAEIELRKSVELGDDYSRYLLGKALIKNGNLSEARDHLEAALNNGFSSAHIWLGYIAERKLAQGRDKSEALEHYQIAAQEGYITGKRRYFLLSLQSANFLKRALLMVSLIFLSVEILLIAYRDPEDKRLYGMSTKLVSSSSGWQQGGSIWKN